MKLDNKDKISILMQEEKMAVSQMAEIKRDEMNWLKVFLIFYGAVIAWMISRWFENNLNSPEIGKFIENEISLLQSTLWFSVVATGVFSFLFIQTRHSYYGVRKRLHRVQEELQLHNENNWNGKSLFALSHQNGEIKNIEDWKLYTKPFSSFTTRLVYIFGANLTIATLAFRAYEWLNHPQGPYFIVTWLLLNLGLLIALVFYDYLQFRQ